MSDKREPRKTPRPRGKRKKPTKAEREQAAKDLQAFRNWCAEFRPDGTRW